MDTTTASEFLDRLVAIRKLLDDAIEIRAFIGIPMPPVDVSIDLCTNMLSTFELELFPYLSESDQALLAAFKNELDFVQ